MESQLSLRPKTANFQASEGRSDLAEEEKAPEQPRTASGVEGRLASERSVGSGHKRMASGAPKGEPHEDKKVKEEENAEEESDEEEMEKGADREMTRDEAMTFKNRRLKCIKNRLLKTRKNKRHILKQEKQLETANPLTVDRHTRFFELKKEELAVRISFRDGKIPKDEAVRKIVEIADSRFIMSERFKNSPWWQLHREEWLRENRVNPA